MSTQDELQVPILLNTTTRQCKGPKKSTFLMQLHDISFNSPGCLSPQSIELQEINKDNTQNNLNDNTQNSNKVLNNSTQSSNKENFKSKLDEFHSKDETNHKQRVSVGQYYLVQSEYDIFGSPADLQKAEIHKQSRLVGVASEEQKRDQNNYCGCCYSLVKKQPLDILCNERELVFLGVGLAQLFMLNKYFGLLLSMIFIVGGSLYVLIMNQYDCGDNCLTIGGLGVLPDKDQGDISFLSSYMQIFTAILIVIAVLYAKKKILKNITHFKQGYVCPSDYTIMVQNLPLDSRMEEIKLFFSKLTNKVIVKISMAYDTTKYNSSISQKQDDIKQFNQTNNQIKKLQESMTSPSAQIQEKINKLTAKNNELSQELKITDEYIERFEQDCQSEKDPSKFLGTAFITFNESLPVDSIVEHWGYTYKNIIKYFFFGCSVSPFVEYKSKVLIIRKAPAPADVIWENLRYSLPRNVTNNTLMLLLSCFILYLSFKIQFFLMEYIYPLKKQSYDDHSFILMLRGSLLSISVVIVNLCLRNTVFFFTKLQSFDHHTKQLNAYINKYIVLYFFNSAFMPYLVHGYIDGDAIDIELLIWDIHFVVLATSVSTPLSKLFDPMIFYKMFKRWHIKSFQNGECPYTQKEANFWFEGHPFEIADSYAYMARVLFLGAWYAQVAPLSILISLIGLLSNHFIDKYFLLRVHPTPQQITEDVYSKVLLSLNLLPFVYLCGGLEYAQKSLMTSNIYEILYEFSTSEIAIIGLFLSILSFLFHFKRKQTIKDVITKDNRPYEAVRTLFSTEYDRSNPVTAIKASNQYIQYLYHQKALVISGLLDEEEIIELHKGRSMYLTGKKYKKDNKYIPEEIAEKHEHTVDGINVEHLAVSGSQAYREKFIESHSAKRIQEQTENQKKKQAQDKNTSPQLKASPNLHYQHETLSMPLIESKQISPDKSFDIPMIGLQDFRKVQSEEVDDELIFRILQRQEQKERQLEIERERKKF